jgi:hypothetical protein
VPRDPDLGFEFLNVKYVPIHHYGVELNGCRYNGYALDDFRGKTSPYLGAAKGRWPIHFDADDISRVYFRHPKERKWHVLAWEHTPMLEAPFSLEALEFARRVAAVKYKYPDDRLAVRDLLKRWNMGLDLDRSERRMALRIARDQAAIELPEPDSNHSGPARGLASLRKVVQATDDTAEPTEPDRQDAEAGDDDDPDDLDLIPHSPDSSEYPDSSPTSDFDDDFYAMALKDTDD